jgi:hypothetical protein
MHQALANTRPHIFVLWPLTSLTRQQKASRVVNTVVCKNRNKGTGTMSAARARARPFGQACPPHTRG